MRFQNKYSRKFFTKGVSSFEKNLFISDGGMSSDDFCG
jgi:hypothetical protein